MKKYISFPKIIFYTLFCLFFIAFYLHTTTQMYVGYWKYLLVFLVLNIGVFEFIKTKRLKGYKPWQQKLILAAFLFSIIFVLLSSFLPLFVTFRNHNPLIRSRLLGIISIAVISQMAFCSIYAMGAIHWFVRTKILKRKNNKLLFKVYAGLGVTASLIVISFFLTASFYGANRIDLKTTNVEIKNLPDSFNNYKIIQISDLHLGSLTKQTLQKAVDMINLQNPDIICFTGDLVTYDAKEIDPYKQILKKLKAKEGIYAILGNHDYGTYSSFRTQQEQQQEHSLIKSYMTDTLQWRLLLNETTFIEHTNGEKIALAGIENLSNEKRFVSRGDLEKTFSGFVANEPVILLSHDPYVWEDKIISKYPFINLTLSGHTHGRQMALSQDGSLICKNFRKFPEKSTLITTYGMYCSNRNYLYISNGIGSTLFHGRLAMWADISTIILKKEDN